jgi:hypothetical protein
MDLRQPGFPGPLSPVGRGVPAEPARAPRKCRSCAGSPGAVRLTGSERLRGSCEAASSMWTCAPAMNLARGHLARFAPEPPQRTRIAQSGRGRPRSGSWAASLATVGKTVLTLLWCLVLAWTQSGALHASPLPARPTACTCCTCSGCDCCVEPQDDPAPLAPLTAPPSASLTETLWLAIASLPSASPHVAPLEPALAAGAELPVAGWPLYRRHCALLL